MGGLSSIFAAIAAGRLERIKLALATLMIDAWKLIQLDPSDQRSAEKYGSTGYLCDLHIVD